MRSSGIFAFPFEKSHQNASMSILSSAYVPSPRRICVVAGATLTQLMRMKIFLFLVIFALILLAFNSLRMSDYLGPEAHGENELTLLKNSAFGAMRLFGLIFCVTATSLLIPKDTEDRILYTILCKPVPRIDYLMGKALGVLALTILAVGIMDLFMSGILWMRTSSIIAEQSAIMAHNGYTAETMRPIIERILNQGPTWNVQAGLLIMIFEFTVLTSLTLLLSCITSGTIISSILAFCAYFIGLFQTQAKSIWMNQHAGLGIDNWELWMTQGISVIFPNFGMYSVTDSALNGQQIPLDIIWQLGLISIAYFLFQTTIAAWIFRHKEF